MGMKWIRQDKEVGECKQPNEINGLKLNFKNQLPMIAITLNQLQQLNSWAFPEPSVQEGKNKLDPYFVGVPHPRPQGGVGKSGEFAGLSITRQACE